MKLLCPYCKKTFDKLNKNQCPHCHRILVVPRSLRPAKETTRRRLRRRVMRFRENVMMRYPAVPLSKLGNRPTHIVIVVALMAVIGAALVQRATRKVQHPDAYRIEYAIDELTAMRIALDRFYRDCGRYPTTEEGLKSIVLTPGDKTWKGPYVNIVKPDPWRVPYHYRFESNTVHLKSAGPDRTLDTDDDMFPSTEILQQEGRKHEQT